MHPPRIQDASGEESKTYRCLEIEISPEIPSITRNGEPLELRAKALQVLIYLFQERHRVVSKEELFEHAWPGVTVVDATLAGCIQEIRKILADDAKSPRYIKTLNKVGYRFIAPLAEESLGAIVEAPARATWFKPLVGLAALVLVAGGVWVFAVARGSGSAVNDFREAAWWKLDEVSGRSVKDASGHGLAGSVVGNAVWEPGDTGGALRFDGSGARADGVDTRAVLPVGNAPRSMAAWVKVSSATGDSAGILHFGVPLAPGAIDSFRLFLLPDGRPAFAHKGYAGIAGDPSLAVGRASIEDQTWRHVAGTFDGARGTLFIDGVPQATVPMPPGPEVPRDRSTAWALGTHINQTISGFRGSINDARIWRRALRIGEVAALYRCGWGVNDLSIPGAGSYYFSPVFDWSASDTSGGVRVKDSEIEHAGFDYAGIQLASRSEGCGVAALHGADIGQDLRVSVDVLVPVGPEGQHVQAGPYFRTRSAAPGDGILGGRSAGYWVQLHSTGQVTVKCLNPVHTVAFTRSAGFDSSVYHRLELTVNGESLEVSLDGQVLMFDQGGQMTQVVKVAPHWERPSKVGENNGASGIAFSSEPMRPRVGGQKARGLKIEVLRAAAK